MKRIDKKETLDQYLIMSGWKPANMQGALSLVEFAIQVCEKEIKEEYPIMYKEEAEFVGWLIDRGLDTPRTIQD